MGILRDLRKTLSAIPLTTIRGNIISNSPRSSIGSDGKFRSDLLSLYDDTLLTTYLANLQELGHYFNADIVQGVLKVLSTPMLSSIADDLVTIDEGSDDLERLKKTKEKFDKLRLSEYVRDNLYYILYYGSSSIALKPDKSDEGFYRIRNLVYPQINISMMYSDDSDDTINDVYKRLVATRKGNLSAGSEDIIRIGLCDLSLYWGGKINEIADESIVKFVKDIEDNSIYDDLSLRAASPLFYRLLEQLKQYTFRSKLAEVLMIRELILPTIFTMAAQNVDQASATSLAQKIENLCNASADSSLIIAANADLQQLYASLMSKVKIIPDFQSVMQNNIQEFDPAKLSEKLKDLIESLPAMKDAILTALGIPVDLYEGKTTRWDTDKSAEKLNKLIKGYKDAIDKSLEDVYATIYTLDYGEEPDPDSYSVKMFESDNSAVYDSIKHNEMITEYVDSFNKLVDTVGDESIFDDKKLKEYKVEILKNAGYEKVIKEKDKR